MKLSIMDDDHSRQRELWQLGCPEARAFSEKRLPWVGRAREPLSLKEEWLGPLARTSPSLSLLF